VKSNPCRHQINMLQRMILGIMWTAIPSTRQLTGRISTRSLYFRLWGIITSPKIQITSLICSLPSWWVTLWRGGVTFSYAVLREDRVEPSGWRGLRFTDPQSLIDLQLSWPHLSPLDQGHSCWASKAICAPRPLIHDFGLPRKACGPLQFRRMNIIYYQLWCLR